MAKKTAKKKTPKEKAAKRGAPSKNCPKCNKSLHAAKMTCDCGYKFPTRKKKRAKRTARSIAAIRSREGALSQELAESIKIVEKAGGLDQAKQMLAAVKELEKFK